MLFSCSCRGIWCIYNYPIEAYNKVLEIKELQVAIEEEEVAVPFILCKKRQRLDE